MPGTSLFKNAGLYRDTRKRWSPVSRQIVTVTSKGEALVHDTLSDAEAIAIRDGLLKTFPLPVPVAPTPDPPAPSPAPAPSRCTLGMVGTPDWPSMITKGCELLAPKLVRLDVARMGTTALQDAAISAVRDAGAEPIVLLSAWQGTGVPAQARAIVDRFGPVLIELGNESSYSYKNAKDVSILAANATAYAIQAKAVAVALQGTGARLLVQADGALWAGTTWVDAMYAAVPDLHVGLHAWTVHPYTAGREVEQVQQMVDATVKHGAPATKPIFVTEYGVASDDGRWLTPKETRTLADGTKIETIYGHPNDLSYKDAAAILTAVHATLTDTFPQLEAFCVYTSIDLAGPGFTKDPEAYFGAMLRGRTLAGDPVEGQPKPYYADAFKALGG